MAVVRRQFEALCPAVADHNHVEQFLWRREEDAKKWTLKKVSHALGVHLDTISGWFEKPRTNSEIRNGS